MGALMQDIRYGLRMLWKSPGFTLAAVLTLALGIGANTAIFSVINGILLRPLPYEEDHNLMFFTEWSQQVPNMSFSVENFKDVRDQSTSFDSMFAFRTSNYVLTGAGEPERLNGRQASHGIFATLRIQPMLGRAFTPEEDKPGAEKVVLLSEGFWVRRFARDPKVIGQSLTLNGESYTVIGVLPAAGFHGSWRRYDLFLPMLALEDQLGGPQRRGSHPGIYVIARRKAGVPVEKARTEIISIAQRLAEQYPNSNAKQSMTAEPLRDAAVGELRGALLLLLGAVGFVLLIACGNVANLQLGRAAARQREIAVRMAMGAGPVRVMRQMLTESVLLSTIGGVLGLLLGYWGVAGLLAWLPSNVPLVEQVAVDQWVLIYTAAISILTGLIFGVVPAWKTSTTDLQETLKEGGRGSLGSGHHRLRNMLVVAEISVALVLLVGAGLMMRSFFRVLEADPGFRQEGVLTAAVPLPQAKFDTDEKRVAFVNRIIENARAVPGVKVAGGTLPLLGGWQTSFSIEGKPEPPPGQMPSTDISRVTPDYFRAMGLRLLQGRAFAEADTTQAPRVCIIDETFANAHWPGESPLGKKIKFGRHNDDGPWMEIVGVVGHVKNYGVDQDSRVETYVPYAQSPVGIITLVLRTDGDPSSLTSGIRQAVLAADPDTPLYATRTLDEIVSEATASRRLAALLISLFAGLALALAAVGIYGVMSYAVSQRTQEIGIRMALGAQQEHILKMVLRQGGLMAGAGVVIGLVAALLLARLMTSLLFQVSTTDPPTFSIVPVVLVAVALLACWLPARRATRVDPMIALRYE